MVAGLGFVLSFGYWCTNFLVVQRAMAAKSMSAARRTPLIAAFPKMLMPFIVILPGIAAVALTSMASGYQLPHENGVPDYDQVTDHADGALLSLGNARSRTDGADGLVHVRNGGERHCIQYGLDLRYLPDSHPAESPDRHYLTVGRISTIGGTLLSIGTAYLAQSVQQHHGPAATCLRVRECAVVCHVSAGMFWTGATGMAHSSGLALGHSRGALTHGLTMAEGKGGWLVNLHTFPSTMAQNFWIAIFAWTTCFVVTILVSLVTKPKPLSELKNLVWGATARPKDDARSWTEKPVMLAIVVGILTIVLNISFR